jgi:hypothetical protein
MKADILVGYTVKNEERKGTRNRETKRWVKGGVVRGSSYTQAGGGTGGGDRASLC